MRSMSKKYGDNPAVILITHFLGFNCCVYRALLKTDGCGGKREKVGERKTLRSECSGGFRV